MSKTEFYPDTVFITEDAKEDALTKRVLPRLKDAEIIYLKEHGDPITQLAYFNDTRSESETFSFAKRKLLLTRYKGDWLKACPGTSEHVCCNLWIVNPGEGCPLDCTYCYLQTYLRRNPTLKIYTNIDEMKQVISEKAFSQPNRLFRIGTGELIDSLVWDSLTDLTKELVPFIARIPNVTLELKSKHDFVENLLELEHRGKTVVSWSVNAREITEKDEAFTASLEKRIAAAKKVIAAGYRVGFHFDPVIHFEGWQDGYQDVVRYIFSEINPKDVAWVSISTLRYKREMQNIMRERFPNSRIPYGEQFLAKDNKLRYFQPLRFRMIDFIWKELKAIDKQMPVYMCMESSAAWQNIAGGSPVAGSELVEIFSRKGKLSLRGSEATVAISSQSCKGN